VFLAMPFSSLSLLSLSLSLRLDSQSSLVLLSSLFLRFAFSLRASSLFVVVFIVGVVVVIIIIVLVVASFLVELYRASFTLSSSTTQTLPDAIDEEKEKGHDGGKAGFFDVRFVDFVKGFYLFNE